MRVGTPTSRRRPRRLITTLRRGEAPILARYEGAYAATTLTVMGDRTGFVWQEPPANSRIDRLVAAKWQRMKILPSDLCTDSEFVRRVFLDLTGLPPNPEEVRQFLADTSDIQLKRDTLVERLMASPEFVDHWANKWADLLQVNRKFLGEEGARPFQDWIRNEIQSNSPSASLVWKSPTGSGSNKESSRLLLKSGAGRRTMKHDPPFPGNALQLQQCHDHPFERWTQDRYYHMAAFFARVDRRRIQPGGDGTSAALPWRAPNRCLKSSRTRKTE